MCRVPWGSTAKLGTQRFNSATVRTSKESIFGGAWSACVTKISTSATKTISVLRPLAFVVGAGNNQHRQCPDATQVGVRFSHLRHRRSGKHPHAGSARLGQLPIEFSVICRVGLSEHGLDARVASWLALHNPYVGQMRVDVEATLA